MDRLERLEDELGKLRTMLTDLSDEVRRLKAGSLAGIHPVEALLTQRGYAVLSHGDPARVLFPPTLTDERLDDFYHLMRRYSFRLFLRDLIQFPAGVDLGPVSRYCSMRTARAYLESLRLMGIIRMNPTDGYELVPRHVISFGPTLEWYVCEVFRRELLAPALSCVRLEMTRSGGDYDVIALLERRLVYVEVKSSPPRGIEIPAVNAFIRRARELQPRLAIFLVDTHLRMKDKIVPMFEDAIAASGAWNDGEAPVLRLVNELFHVGHTLYIVNARKGIYSNLRVCIRDHVRFGARAGRLSGSGS